MKILYHHRVASKDGQYVHIEEIINSLTKLGHEIILVAPSMGENQDFGGDGGLVSKLKSQLPQWLYEIIEFMYSFWALAKLAKAIITHKPDFIYERYNLFNPSGIWAKKIFRKPLLLEINAPLLEERSKYDGISLPGLARWSQEYTWKNADMCLPVTDVLADYQRNIGVPESKIKVIPNGINKSEFMDKKHVNPLDINVSDKVVLGFIGFCREWHGLDKIVELLTLPGNEKLFFLLVGDGPAVPGIRDIATKKGIEERIHITGLVHREQMPSWLVPIDIALQPAVVDYASPLKMLEYMATGKAIVAPDQRNIKELLTDGDNALLFNVNEQQSFVDACQKLITDQTLRTNMAKRAYDSVFEKALFWDANAETILTMADKLLAQVASSSKVQN